MNKSGVAAQVISHPQGGGAIKGLGDTFSPDLHTGTGNLTVPIAIPPGRNKLQPDVSLVSVLGVGTPRGLQGRWAAVMATVLAFIATPQRRWTELRSVHVIEAIRGLVTLATTLVVNSSAAATCPTGS